MASWRSWPARRCLQPAQARRHEPLVVVLVAKERSRAVATVVRSSSW